MIQDLSTAIFGINWPFGICFTKTQQSPYEFRPPDWFKYIVEQNYGAKYSTHLHQVFRVIAGHGTSPTNGLLEFVTRCIEPAWDAAVLGHHSALIMSALANQITGVSIIYSTVCSGTDQWEDQSSVRWPVNSLHRGPVTRKMFPFDDVIMVTHWTDIPDTKLLSILFSVIFPFSSRYILLSRYWLLDEQKYAHSELKT